jgi:hypothetical protein
MWHEAAHAVACHELGGTVLGIRAHAKGDEGGGRVDYDGMRPNERRTAVMMAAGAVGADVFERERRKLDASAYFRGEEPSGHKRIHPAMSDEDNAAIAEYLHRNFYSGASAQQETRAIIADAHRLVQEHLDTIQDVATALNDTEQSDGAGGLVFSLGRDGFLKAIGE